MLVDEIPKLVMKHYNRMLLEIEKTSKMSLIYFLKTPDFENSNMCYLMYGWYLQQALNIDEALLAPIESNKREYLDKIKTVDWTRVFTEKITAKDILKSLDVFR